MKHLVSVLCVCALALLLFSGAALAAEEPLRVTQSASQGAQASVVTYTLTAETPDAPMPQGSENGAYRFELTGAAAGTLPLPAPEKTGVWRYTLTAECATAKITPEKITLTVYAERKNGALTVTSLATLPAGEKTELCFDLRAEGTTPTPNPTSGPKPTPTPKPGNGKTPKTGDDTNLIPYYAATAFSLIAIVFLARGIRREKQENTA